MKFNKILVSTCICLVLFSNFSYSDKDRIAPLSSNRPPNILLILTDDQGWGDLGFNGNQHIETPELDKLFNQGLRFDRFYVSPVCSPTRASLLTGRHSLATGVYSVTRGGEKMHKTELTIAEILKKYGYTTGLFGKWHNGHQYPYDPKGQGFEEFYGFTDGHITRYFDDTLIHNGKAVQYSGYVADAITEKAIEFIHTNQGMPFLAFMSYNTPHSPFELPEHYFKKYKKKGLSDLDASVYGMVENIDDNVGRLRQQLAKLDLAENTIVIFLSDNGPAFPNNTPRYNGGMAGKKGKTDEGGVRVPFVIEWSKLKDNWSIPYPVQHIDLLPTLLSLIGVPYLQDNIHGRDLSEFITQSKALSQWQDKSIFIHHFHNTRTPNEKSVKAWPGAVRNNRWLASVDQNQQWHLYDLLSDPKQKKDLAKTNKKVLSKLKKQYKTWYKKTVSEHGDYNPLPVEIGHPESPTVMFPAHEAALDNDGVRYAHRDGWAHDWIENNKNQTGEISWPIKVMTQGIYRFILKYSAPDGNIPTGLSLSINKQDSHKRQIIAKSPELIQYTAQRDEGERKYYTGEAPQLKWKETVLGEATLDTQKGGLILSVPKAPSRLMIKGLVVERVK